MTTFRSRRVLPFVLALLKPDLGLDWPVICEWVFGPTFAFAIDALWLIALASSALNSAPKKSSWAGAGRCRNCSTGSDPTAKRPHGGAPIQEEPRQ
jgi:hypothetical protein